MEKLKTQKGITLIVLVAMIVIMLILVAVTINISLNGGLFANAKEATDRKQIGIEKEKLLASVMRSLGRDGKVDFDSLDNDLPDDFTKVADKTYKSPEGNKYEVTEDGTVILLEQNGEDSETETDTETPTTCAHTNTKVEGAVEATCTSNGYTGDQVCSDCGQTISNGETIAATGHQNTSLINVSDTYTGDTYCNDCNVTIAKGETVTDKTLNPDDGTTPNSGNTYTYGDYKYTYSSSIGGWSVAINTDVTDKNQVSYGPILESINGEPITSIRATFRYCSYLVTAPKIPSSVTDMDYAFDGCDSLTTAPVIPSGITSLIYTFSDCGVLSTPPEIPSSVTNMEHTFSYCESLSVAPIIPSDVTNMTSTFNSCTSLSTAPEIPSKVSSMSYTFFGCTSLTGTITINANPTSYNYCFTSVSMREITIAGSCTATLKQTLANTGLNGDMVTIIN